MCPPTVHLLFKHLSQPYVGSVATRPFRRGGALAFTVDLSAVTVLSSDGAQALAQLIEQDPLGNVPSLVAPSGSLAREVLALTGLDGRMEILEHPPAPQHGRHRRQPSEVAAIATDEQQ